MLQRTSEPQDSSFTHDPRNTGDGRPFDTGLDLRAYLQIARRRGRMVAAVALLFGIIAVIYALQLTPVYTARATLLLDPPENKTLDTEAILAGAPIDSAAIENQIELIKTASM